MNHDRKLYLIFADEHGIADLFDSHIIPNITGSLCNRPINQAIEFIEEWDRSIDRAD